MKKQLLFLLIFYYGLYFGQVGINTITPSVTLDVKAKTTGLSPTIAEGLTVPRLSRADLIAKMTPIALRTPEL